VSAGRLPPGPERPNVEALAAFGADPDRGPVTMLNLLKLRPDGGAETYAEYGLAVAPLLEKVGGRIVHAGGAGAALIGRGDWDLVVLVEYPTHRAFLQMILSEEYAEIADLRNKGLERTELHPIYSDDLPMPASGDPPPAP